MFKIIIVLCVDINDFVVIEKSVPSIAAAQPAGWGEFCLFVCLFFRLFVWQSCMRLPYCHDLRVMVSLHFPTNIPINFLGPAERGIEPGVIL